MASDGPTKIKKGVNDKTADEIRQHHKMAMGRKIPDMKKSAPKNSPNRRGGRRGS